MPESLRPLPDRPADTGFHDALRALLIALGVSEVPASDVPHPVPWVRRVRLAFQ